MSSAVHISLNVSDLDSSVAFYRRFFGEPRKLKTDYAKFVAEEPEIHLAPNKLVKYSYVAMVLAESQRLGVTKIGLIGNEQFIR